MILHVVVRRRLEFRVCPVVGLDFCVRSVVVHNHADLLLLRRQGETEEAEVVVLKTAADADAD